MGWSLESVFGVLDVAVTLGFVFQGVASKLNFCAEIAILVDGSVLRTCRNHSKRKIGEAHMI